MGDLTRAFGMTRTPSSYLGKWVHYTEECEHGNMVGENMLASHDHDHDHLHDHLNDKNSVFVSGKETTVIILRRVNMTGFIGGKTEWTAKISSCCCQDSNFPFLFLGCANYQNTPMDNDLALSCCQNNFLRHRRPVSLRCTCLCGMNILCQFCQFELSITPCSSLYLAC